MIRCLCIVSHSVGQLEHDFVFYSTSWEALPMKQEHVNIDLSLKKIVTTTLILSSKY